MITCVTMRYGSRRLPGKALIDLGGVNAMDVIKGQLKDFIHRLVICCPKDSDGDPIADYAKKIDLLCYRGSLSNVLQRMVEAAESFGAESFIRITGDDIFIDPYYLEKLAYSHKEKNADISFSDLPKGTEGLIVKTSFARNLLSSYGDNTEYWDRYDRFQNKAWKNACINFVPLSPTSVNENTFALELDTYENMKAIVGLLKTLRSDNIVQPYRIEDLVRIHQVSPFPFSKDPVDRTYFNNV